MGEAHGYVVEVRQEKENAEDSDQTQNDTAHRSLSAR